MSATLLPELAAESVETAERLGRLSAEECLDSAEAEYILTSRLAAIQLVPMLWPIIRRRIGGGMMGHEAQQLLASLLDAVDRNLTLAGKLKEAARIVSEEPDGEADLAADLSAVEHQLWDIRAQVARLLKIVDAPAPWPGEEQLREAKERMQAGDMLTAEEFRHSILDG